MHGQVIGIAAAVAALAVLPVRAAHADAATAMTGGAVTATTGAGIYQHVCQGCHQPGGVGAKGAASIPALAGDPRLASTAYPVYIVLHGDGAMPWFDAAPANGGLSDAQIAAVVSYIRGSFGNAYPGLVTPAQVASMRPTAPVLERY
jgi:mono/diheme cytochrome c family protein